jgi:DNA helicase II / ATP-dependent DNA helicase PcrA
LRKPWRPENFTGNRGETAATGSQQAVFDSDDPEKILQGMVVEHQRFGVGKVLKVEGLAPNKKATVFFHNAGNKQLLLKFAKLKNQRIRQLSKQTLYNCVL